MDNRSDAVDLRRLFTPHALLHPSTLLLVAANLVPLFGVAFWHWDVFLLLMLYWMETAAIAFWTIARIAATPRAALIELKVEINSRRTSTNSPLAIVAFFVVHAGVFMAVHFVFLWVMFSADWAREIHGRDDFVRLVVVGSGLWVPLLGLFISRGAAFLFHVLRPRLLQRLEHALFPRRPLRPTLNEQPSSPADEIAMLYVRIILMQFVIVIGAGLSTLFGTIAPFLLFIVFKTMVDVVIHIVVDFGGNTLKGIVSLPATR